MKFLDKKSRAFLENLLTTPSPSGFEKAGQQLWLEYVNLWADEIQTDAYGSAAALLHTNNTAITVMLEAHCDEIAMIVQHIDDLGFVYMNRIGGSDPGIVRARKVDIHTADGVVSGVTGHTAIHLQDKSKKSLPDWSDLYIDIGVNNREQALSMIQIGDPITFSDTCEFYSDEMLVGRALDNRAGGFILAKVLESLQERRKELKVNVVALNAVQEETGGFGARMMAYRYEPDVALVTDVTHATDTPGISHKQHGWIKLGEGPVVSHGGANHPMVIQHISTVARHANIPIQHEATGTRTGTDTDSIFYQKRGIPSGLVSLPLRYMHTPVETVSLQDMYRLACLLTESICRLEEHQSFSLF